MKNITAAVSGPHSSSRRQGVGPPAQVAAFTIVSTVV